MKTAIILGSKSEIAEGLAPFLKNDGWAIENWYRGGSVKDFSRWKLALVCLGQIAPVGDWREQYNEDVLSCYESNLFLPWRLLRAIWDRAEEDASVCFLAGSNPNRIMAGYSAYNTSKMALLKLCEQLDFETPNAKFFALAPGYVDTKIHQATLESGIANEVIERGKITSFEKIYNCLEWCIRQPKEIVGGRNICVSDPYGVDLYDRLETDSNLFKLRRYEGR